MISRRLQLAVVGISLLIAGSAAGQPFAPSCTIPFDSIAVHHRIDSSCGLEGDASGDQPHAAQNLAKNNLCATGAPALVTFLSFKKLQQKVDLIPGAKGWIRTNLPHDRSVLTGIYTTSDGATLDDDRRTDDEQKPHEGPPNRRLQLGVEVFRGPDQRMSPRTSHNSEREKRGGGIRPLSH